MDCLFCNQKTKVTNSRKSGKAKVWRRRQCLVCKNSFTTQETPNIENLLSVSDSSSKKSAPYSRAKLELSLLKACDHLASRQELYIQSVINTVEVDVLAVSGPTKTITTADIARVASLVLKRLDVVAYLKYCTNHNITPDNKVLNGATY